MKRKPRAPQTRVIVDVGGTHTRIYFQKNTSRLKKILDASTQTSRLKPQIVSALKRSRLTPLKLTVGLRGVWTAQEKKSWNIKLKGIAPHVHVMSDIELAHQLAFKGGDGIVLNVGTGSIAFGRKGKKIARAGGLGPLLGDEGSAFWIGQQYLKAVYRKSGNFLSLRKLVKSEDAIARTAAFAKRVIKKASHDRESRAILQSAAKHLNALVVDVKQQLRIKGRFPVKVVGGLAKRFRFLRGHRSSMAL